MLENQDNGNNTSRIVTTRPRNGRCRSFHLRYLELCRSKNIAPLADIRKNNKDQATLDFFGDKVAVADWLLITNALFCDQILHTVSIRLRKCQGPVLVHIDSERKTKLFKQKPVIYTKFIFSGIVESLSKCIDSNKNLRILNLEGLPLNENYVESIAKAISSNTNIKELSFARSSILDHGCEIICNTIKYLDNIDKLNLTDTGLTTKGALCVADMIKIQKISRFTAGWQQSLRYRDFDASNIPGLSEILLARNPQIGDNGLSAIADVLKEDIWVKIIDMENCGLTDRGANILLDCLKGNKFLIEFNVRGNPGISKFILRDIIEQLHNDEEIERTAEDILRDFNEGRVNGEELMKKPKITIHQLINQLRATNEQLELERRTRKKAEQLNEKLIAQIMAYESKLSSLVEGVPDGYVVVKSESLQSIIRERNDLQKKAESEQIAHMVGKKEQSPRTIPLSARTTRLSFRLHEEKDVQFTAPLPEPPSISPSESARSVGSNVKSARQPGQIRKVKSEMKYVEQPKRMNSLKKKKDTKSDYDYGTESDVPRFETNIGDTVANVGAQKTTYNQQTINRRTIQYSGRIQYVKKHEVDEIAMSSTRSHGSDAASAESDTLRRNENVMYEQSKAFKNFKAMTNEYGQGEGSGTGAAAGMCARASTSYSKNGNKNSGNNGVTKQRRSPRSLFLGLCDD